MRAATWAAGIRRILKAGVVAGSRGAVNFIEGSGVTIVTTDDPTNDKVDVTITSTASGGVTDHGALTGLADDDHPQYATDTDLTNHNAAADPHTGYRLESADHSHATTGLQGGTVAHSVLTGITATDHHVAPAAGPDADVTVDVAGAAGTASTFARSGHGHKVSTSASAAVAVGTAAAGTSGHSPSRDDHVHPTGAGTPSTQAFSDAAVTGSGPAASMTDHKHAMPADPVTAHVAASDPHTVYALDTDLPAKLSSADLQQFVEGNEFRLLADLTLPGNSELLFADPESLEMSAPVAADKMVVPSGYFRMHYNELQLDALNDAALQETAELVLFDFGPRSTLVLDGVG